MDKFKSGFLTPGLYTGPVAVRYYFDDIQQCVRFDNGIILTYRQIHELETTSSFHEELARQMRERVSLPKPVIEVNFFHPNCRCHTGIDLCKEPESTINSVEAAKKVLTAIKRGQKS